MSRLGTILRRLGWLAGGIFILLLLLAWKGGLVGIPRIIGYYSPIFSPDGTAVFLVQRDARAIVTGLGYEMFTPPANVRYVRDRYALWRIRVSDGAVSSVATFPPSPLERTSVQGYHNALFGMPAAHLRWSDPGHLDYEIAVTKFEVPSSRTFVVRELWDNGSKYESTGEWREAPPRMGGGFEPQQLHGDLELIAVPGPEAIPCAVVILRTGDTNARALVETPVCHATHPAGYSSAELAPLSRRKEIESAENVRTTYAALIARGRQAGLREGEAYLAANDEMERLGLYPRTKRLIAAVAACDQATPLFSIADDEFAYGLFPDIERAIAKPGERVHLSGSYFPYPGYTTSKRLNEFLATGATRYFVKAHGRCWLMTIDQ